MRRLILMRHAKAERVSAEGDIGRPLSQRGLADAALMGRVLAERGLRPDLALVSAATRTRQTWDAARDAFGDVEAEIEPRLYEADADRLRQAVEAVEDRCETLILVGHNPAIHDLAVDLLTEAASSPSVLERFSAGFPTGAAAVFDLDAAGRAAYGGFFKPSDHGGGAGE